MSRLFSAMRVLAAVFAVTFAVLPARASEQSEAVAVVRQFVDAWNRGDNAAVARMVAPSISIIDAVPPYIWQGQSADTLKQWNEDVGRYFAKNPVDEVLVKLGKADPVLVQDDGAYVVAPATLRTRKHAVWTDDHAILAVTLKRTDTGWLVGSISWAEIKKATK